MSAQMPLGTMEAITLGARLRKKKVILGKIISIVMEVLELVTTSVKILPGPNTMLPM